MSSQAQLLAWITRHLRTVETSERLPSHHETYVYWAMIIVTTRRLARKRGLPSQILFEPRNYLTQLLTDKSYPRRLLYGSIDRFGNVALTKECQRRHNVD